MLLKARHPKLSCILQCVVVLPWRPGLDTHTATVIVLVLHVCLKVLSLTPLLAELPVNYMTAPLPQAPQQERCRN